MDDTVFERYNVSVSGVLLSFKGNMMTDGKPQILDCSVLNVVAIDEGMIRLHSIHDPNTLPMFLVRVLINETRNEWDQEAHIDIVTDMDKYSPVFYEGKHETTKEFAMSSKRVMDTELNWADKQRINSMIELLISDQMHLMEDKNGDDETD